MNIIRPDTPVVYAAVDAAFVAQVFQCFCKINFLIRKSVKIYKPVLKLPSKRAVFFDWHDTRRKIVYSWWFWRQYRSNTSTSVETHACLQGRFLPVLYYWTMPVNSHRLTMGLIDFVYLLYQHTKAFFIDLFNLKQISSVFYSLKNGGFSSKIYSIL